MDGGLASNVGEGSKIFSLSPKIRWLFCFTHPDDEITIAIWIKRLCAAGVEVHMCWTHSTPIRKAEAVSVATRLGVPESSLHFLDGNDGQVCDEIQHLLPQFRELMARLQPDRVCCGAFEQGHLDHDATNYVVNQTFNGPVYEIPFYHTYFIFWLQRFNRFSRPEGQEVLELTEAEVAEKKAVAKSYPSQNIWSLLLYHEIGQALLLRAPQLAKTERMRLQTHKDFRTPSHPPLKSLLVRLSRRWRIWLDAVEKSGHLK